MYDSCPRSRSTASIRRFHSIQFVAFNILIRYDPPEVVFEDSSDIVAR